jgi:BolA protein
MQSEMPSRADRLAACLTAAFAPVLLRITDDSGRHAGHAGMREDGPNARHPGAAAGGETHYAVLLVSAAFAGQSRVARARAVHAALEAEFAGGLHALALTLRAPEEAT